MTDLLGSDFGLAEANKPYGKHGIARPQGRFVLASGGALARHVQRRFRSAPYDLTSTQFGVHASDLPEGSKRRHGYNRDKRPDATGDLPRRDDRVLAAGLRVSAG